MNKLIGIGIGPGEPELITLKAKQALAAVDIVFVPKSRLDKDSVAYNIVSQFISHDTEIVDLLLPMTKDHDTLQQAWVQGAKQIVAALTSNKTGAFITLGDCMLYSTYTYILKEVKKLDSGIIVENIPGVTSFASAASALSLPLAEGEENLVIIPALNKTTELARILAIHENIIFLKIASQIGYLVETLKEMGLEKNAVFISKCGHSDQEIIYDLEALKKRKLEYLSLMIVKKGGLS